MKERELIEKRGLREKHFLQEDGTIIANIYSENIHYYQNGKYKEIDNELVLKDGVYTNRSNKYKVFFPTNSINNLFSLKIGENFLDFYLKNSNDVNVKNINSKVNKELKYEKILKNIDIDYKMIGDKIKESIILNEYDENLECLIFEVKTDLKLLINDNKTISVISDGKIIFCIDAPYMVDADNNKNFNICYKLEEKKYGYDLILNLDKIWLNSKNIKYPVLIDPTINTYAENTGLYDTYIFPGDTYVDRNNQSYLKVGVERENNTDTINRALIKFDLPVIGTGSQIINSELNLFSMPGLSYNQLLSYNRRHINVHEVTQSWDEQNANWNDMNTKFNPRIVDWSYGVRSVTGDTIYPTTFNITELVKKWYENKQNFGIMLKDNEEIYANELIPSYYSKNNEYGSENNPKPYLTIQYRNYNGLEEYLNYTSNKFNGGVYYINNYNGNLITQFNIGRTLKGKKTIALDLFYNTNDVVLNNNKGFGKGYKLNLQQEIKKITVSENTYLEYLDGDGTIHYFTSSKEVINENNETSVITDNNTYYDEDGLNMSIVESLNSYLLKDKYGNELTFNKNNDIGYLSEIKDCSNNVQNVYYDLNNLITRIVDADNQEILITYSTNQITVTCPDSTTYLMYTNGKLSTITSYIGNLAIDYNSNDCIETITDYLGLKYRFDYYSQIPYRIMKNTEYSVNNVAGGFIEYTYGLNSTTINDKDNKYKTIVFKDNGTVTSISNLKCNEEIFDAYGKCIDFWNMYQMNNKIANVQLPIKHVKNYISNSSFEDNVSHGFIGTNISNISIVDTDAMSGNKCLRFYIEQGGASAKKIINVKKGKHYTFSAYCKSDGDAVLQIGYNNNINSSKITASSNFTRFSVTIYYPEDNSGFDYGDLEIGFMFNTAIGYFYIDDIQLEEGQVANNYNYIYNSDFSENADGFTFIGDSNNYEITTLSTGKKALKIKMNPAITTGFTKEFNLPGKAGDSYNISFWYKNEGLSYESTTGMGEKTNNLDIQYFYINDNEGTEIFPAVLHSNKDEWQFFSCTFVAEKDFSKIRLNLWEDNNANNLYITNMCLFKDIRSINKLYDESGNLRTFENLAKKAYNYNYDKNNALVKSSNPVGETFVFEYDNNDKQKLINGISCEGISNQYKYDENNNVLSTRISNYNQHNDICSGLYSIRIKGTDSYLRLINGKINVDSNLYNYDLWNIIQEGEYFKIRHSIISSLYFTNNNDELLLYSYNNDSSLFRLIINDNGSYSLQSKNNYKYLKYDNNTFSFVDNKDDYKCEFYFESLVNKLFMETNAKYTSDGKNLISSTDSLLRETIYNYDSTTGLISSVLTPKNQLIEYNYNIKRQLTSVSIGNRTTNYVYNNNNLLSKIIQGNKEYNFLYNDFLRMNSVKIGNNITLFTNTYGSSNGNLMSTLFGNNQNISFSYDEFGRLSVVTKSDGEYFLEYDSNGNLAKVISSNETKKIGYDLAKRVVDYEANDIIIQNDYDSNGNIHHKNSIINIDGMNYMTEYVVNTYNNEHFLSQSTINIDNMETVNLDYSNDYLGRLVNKNININNNDYTVNYQYQKNGKRTSLLITKETNNNESYKYKYSKNNSITHIYNNDDLINKYIYNNYNELTEEYDYDNQIKYNYSYDNYGNIILSQKYSLNNNNIISQDIYSYENNDWLDQLTKFNNNIITYDGMGNMTSFDGKTFNWINGTELQSIQTNQMTYSYKYNENGIRCKKTIKNSNNEVIDNVEYILYGNKILLEKHNDYSIKYIYEKNNNLVGFKYYGINNAEELYFYEKNIFGDIIGIMNSSMQIIAKYKYDSWGNIISIKDGNGNNISVNSNSIAIINPFRYRSYYYDNESELYYLNSRYYNAKIRRFINCDKVIISDNLLPTNLYYYSANDPVNKFDSNGNLFGLIVAAISITVGIAVGVAALTSKKTKTKIKKTVEKITKTVSDTWNKVTKTFTIDVGVGAGYGTMGNSVYKDDTYKYEDGEWDHYQTSYAGLKGLSITVEHKADLANPEHLDSQAHDGFMTPMWEYWNCIDTEKTIDYSITQNIFKLFLDGEFGLDLTAGSNNFVGLSTEWHGVVGFHLNIGFKTDKYLNVH